MKGNIVRMKKVDYKHQLEELQQENKQQKELINKIKEYCGPKEEYFIRNSQDAPTYDHKKYFDGMAKIYTDILNLFEECEDK